MAFVVASGSGAAASTRGTDVNTRPGDASERDARGCSPVGIRGAVAGTWCSLSVWCGVGVGGLVIWARWDAARWRRRATRESAQRPRRVISVDRWAARTPRRSAQAPVRAPPQGAATVIAVVRATGDIVGRVVVFGLFGSIIGHLLRGESAVCTSRSTACKRVSTRRSRRSLAPCRSSLISSGRGPSNPFRRPGRTHSRRTGPARAVSSPSRASPRTAGRWRSCSAGGPGRR